MGLRQDSILLARKRGPAELLEDDRRRLKGVVLEEGSLTAHVIIVARAMGVPVIGRVRDVRTSIREGDLLLLDAAAGTVQVRPTAAMLDAFEAKLEISQKRRADLAALRDLPAVTRGGVPSALMSNAGFREALAAPDRLDKRRVGKEGVST